MKRYVALLLTILSILTIFSGCFGGSGTTEKPLIYHLPDVTLEMQQASYWIDDLKNGDKELLSADQIAKINAQIATVAANNTTDLISYPSSLTVSQITAMLSELEIKETELYTADGAGFEEGYMESLAASVGRETLQTTTKVSYGVMLDNEALRTQPTSTMAFADTENRTVDLFQRGLVSIGEPVIVIYTNAEQTWFFVKTANNYGWLPADSIVFMEKGSWVSYIESPDFLVVTGSEVVLDHNPVNEASSALTLRMGTKLPLFDLEELASTSVDGQGIGSGYVVKLPTKNSLGYIEYIPLLIPASADVSIGYLPYSSENIVSQAFKLLGKRYCENGIYNGRDNASTICDIYKTFGFNLPATTKLQAAISANETDVSDLITADTLEKFKKIPVGTLLFTADEALIYVGKVDDTIYVIHPAKSFYVEGKRYDANSTVLSTLNIVKKDGTAYIDALDTIKELKVGK